MKESLLKTAMTRTIGLVPGCAVTTKVKAINMIDGRSDMRDYTSDSVINDLKVDSTTSLPVHIDVKRSEH
jgi:hypothetical protein